MIRVLLADDQRLFREGLRTLLSLQPGIEVIGEASNGEAAVQLALDHTPEVVLMDVQMPLLDGVAATRQLRQLAPAVRVILLTTYDDDAYVFEGLRAGAVGYLLKDASVAKLVEAIQTAARGETFLPPLIAAKVFAELNRQTAPRLIDQPLPEPLTVREIEIMRLMARGKNNHEIASTLVISEGTVKNHVTNIFSKLSVRDRTQAVLKAQELRLV
jgi:DNA-binding NarL/FixJ family response regulator